MNLFACLLLSTFGLIQEGPRPSGPPSWVTVQRVDAKCRTSFPQDPRYETQWVMTSRGRLLLHRLVTAADEGVHMVCWYDVPRGTLRNVKTADVLARMRDGLIAALEGQLVEEKPHRLIGPGNRPYPGLECRLTGPRGVQVRARFYLVNERLYQLLAVGTAAQVDAPETRERFFDRFAVTP